MKYIQNIFRSFISLLIVSISISAAQAEEHTILSVVDANGTAEYNFNQLDAFTQHTFETATPWTERHQFSGPLLKDVLLSSGHHKGKTIKAYAINDYIVEINRDLLEEYPVILATRKDGKKMRIRDKGPIWIMFPLDQYPELQTLEIHGQMVWQLKKLESR